MTRRTLAALVVFGATACGPDAADDPVDAGPPCEFVLSWGYRAPGGDYQAFADGSVSEITLGFQGFQYIQSSMRVSGASAKSGSFSFRVIVDGHAPYTLADTPAELAAGPGGMLYADKVNVFFDDVPLAELIGRNADVTARGKVGGCTGTTAATVMLADDDPCMEGPSGEPLCPGGDAGVDAGTSDGAPGP